MPATAHRLIGPSISRADGDAVGSSDSGPEKDGKPFRVVFPCAYNADRSLRAVTQHDRADHMSYMSTHTDLGTATRAFPLDRHGKTLTVGAKVRYVGSIEHMHGAVGEIVFIVERGDVHGTAKRPYVFAHVLAPDLAEAVAAGMCVPTDADYQTLNYAHAASFVRLDD